MPIERFWVEVNSRVNYPIKNALVEFDNSSLFDMDDETERFCVSWVAMKVANYGLNICVGAWNAHPIAGEFFQIDLNLCILICSEFITLHKVISVIFDPLLL